MDLLHEDLTGMIIKAFYNVYNKMGFGFAEKVYENSLAIELRKLGLKAEKQVAINVYYDEELVGSYFADLLVENTVIVELKAVSKLIGKHEAQILNYLKATEMEVGLLLNFGENPEVMRKIFHNYLK